MQYPFSCIPMQYPFSCIPATYGAIETTLSPARLGRYLASAKDNKQLALRLYVWNARLCEAIYLPLQVAEVASRNAISKPVQKRFGQKWYKETKFINLLPTRHKQSLASTVSKEESRRKQGLNQDHIVAGLPFGFWVSLMTKAYDKHLWANGVVQSFPNIQKGQTREEIYTKLDQMRHFRNKVAHHYAVFDCSIQNEVRNAVDITGLICSETRWFSNEVSSVNKTINKRPRS